MRNTNNAYDTHTIVYIIISKIILYSDGTYKLGGSLQNKETKTQISFSANYYSEHATLHSH